MTSVLSAVNGVPAGRGCRGPDRLTRLPRLRAIWAFCAFLVPMPACRSRGLMNSSMPKLTSDRAVPIRAMARPAGPNHHHELVSSALSAWAQYRIVPHDHCVTSVRPRNARLAWVRMAPVTVPRKDAAITASWLGRMSRRMIFDVRSPVARAASTKSRLRKDNVCARSTRAPQAQPVSAITRMMPSEPLCGR